LLPATSHAWPTLAAHSVGLLPFPSDGTAGAISILPFPSDGNTAWTASQRAGTALEKSLFLPGREERALPSLSCHQEPWTLLCPDQTLRVLAAQEEAAAQKMACPLAQPSVFSVVVFFPFLTFS